MKKVFWRFFDAVAVLAFSMVLIFLALEIVIKAEKVNLRTVLASILMAAFGLVAFYRGFKIVIVAVLVALGHRIPSRIKMRRRKL